MSLLVVALLTVFGAAPCATAHGGAPLSFTQPVANTGERDQQLDELFSALKAAKSQSEADPIAASIWSIWNKSGSAAIDDMMQFALKLMNSAAFAPALEVLNTIVQKAPEYAEGWNRRATLYYILDQYELSLRDCEEALRREPRHFGALTGMAMIAIAQGKDAAALKHYRRALQVNPFLRERQEMIPALEKKVEGSRCRRTRQRGRLGGRSGQPVLHPVARPGSCGLKPTLG